LFFTKILFQMLLKLQLSGAEIVQGGHDREPCRVLVGGAASRARSGP
jgi:hypothetical protein